MCRCRAKLNKQGEPKLTDPGFSKMYGYLIKQNGTKNQETKLKDWCLITFGN